VENIVIVLPAYEPDPRFVGLVAPLKDHFRSLVIVNDGSRRAASVFSSLPEAEGLHLLDHPVNRGKGAALKTAFDAVMRLFPDAVGAITADADGQHLPKDILNVSRALLASPDRLVLGVRTFGPGTPFRSRLGNLWTIGEFQLLTGRRVRDTQSGLRGIPLRLLPMLAALPGERYDYEIGMLVTAAVTLGGVTEVPIETVYADGNATSHFRPLADTLSTQKALFAAALTARFGSRSPA